MQVDLVVDVRVAGEQVVRVAGEQVVRVAGGQVE